MGVSMTPWGVSRVPRRAAVFASFFRSLNFMLGLLVPGNKLDFALRNSINRMTGKKQQDNRFPLQRVSDVCY
jgi:hypothetical protein